MIVHPDKEAGIYRRTVVGSSRRRSAKIKVRLCAKLEHVLREALIEAMGRALEAVTAMNARGFFEHRGYRATAQLR